jgi:23S rRNA G2069 N7-methylase RlmK/C1962 C5-methylase RlmI
MGDTDAKTANQAEMLANRLKKRNRHLAKWAQRLGTDAFRLYDRDIPEIPLVLDKYGDTISGALYQRPYEKDEAEEEQWLAAMREAVAQALGLEQDNIIIKRREHQRGNAQYEKRDNQKLTRIVHEGNLKFRVNLSDYLDTGIFLDRRAMRRLVGADSKGKRVLNLFCYTGSFSVHAAGGSNAAGGGGGAPGSGATCSVDLSNTYLAWARDNFALNGFKTETLRLEEYFSSKSKRTGSHQLVRADVAVFLHRAAEARLRWDTIILDPPAFSNSTGAADFDLQRDYANLLAQCCALLAKDGKLWFSAAARSFKTNAEELEAELAKHHLSVTVTDIGNKIIDEDFKNRKMPKAFEVVNKR